MATSTLITAPRVNKITGAVVSAAMKVHSHLAPGLLESAYEACLAHELRKQGMRVSQQVGLPVVYEGERIDLGYRIDLIGEDQVIVEIKCVEGVNAVHHAQLLSYIRPSDRNVGLLINFHVAHLRDGIKRMVDGKDWEREAALSALCGQKILILQLNSLKYPNSATNTSKPHSDKEPRPSQSSPYPSAWAACASYSVCESPPAPRNPP